MNVRDLLGSADLFRSFDEAAVDDIAAVAEPQTLSRGDVVFEEGEEPHHLYVVSSGRIAIGNRSIDGRESVVALMVEGDLFGELGLFDGKTRSASARALESTQLYGVPYTPLRVLLEKRPELLWDVVALLSRRLRATDETLADAVFLDVPGRTAKRLLELAGERDEFVLPITQEELAGMVGASRERVNKAIATFVRLGWLQQSDRRYKIADRDQLALRAR